MKLISRSMIVSAAFAAALGGCEQDDSSASEVSASAALANCTSASFVGGTVSATHVQPSGAYTITCDYGSQNNSIDPVIGSGTCTYTGFIGNAAQFACTAGPAAGTFANGCKLSNLSPHHFCARTDAIASLTVGAAANPPPPPPTTPGSVAIGSFGSVGAGGDDTAIFKDAMNKAVAQGKILEVTPGTYKLGAITPPSNLQMTLDANVCINQNGNFGSSDVWVDLSNQNITIKGAGGAAACGAGSSVFMATAGYNQSVNDGSQYRHCLRLAGSNIKVDGIGCNNSGGDGMYVVNPANNITVTNSVFDHNIRDGGSGISGQHVTINGCSFSNQTDFARSGIADGFDFEPNNANDLLVDWNLSNDTMSGNQFDGVGFSLGNLSDPSKQTTITLNGVAANGSGRYGFFVQNNGTTNSGGAITCNGCSGDNNGNANAIARFWEANGPSLTFNSFTSTNNSRLGADAYGIIAGVAIGGGGGNSTASGNVHFFKTNVTATRGYYFDLEDFSGHGLASVDFTGGTLSGGVSGCNGLLSGNCEASVHVP